MVGYLSLWRRPESEREIASYVEIKKYLDNTELMRRDLVIIIYQSDFSFLSILPFFDKIINSYVILDMR